MAGRRLLLITEAIASFFRSASRFNIQAVASVTYLRHGVQRKGPDEAVWTSVMLDRFRPPMTYSGLAEGRDTEMLTAVRDICRNHHCATTRCTRRRLNTYTTLGSISIIMELPTALFATRFVGRILHWSWHRMQETSSE
jgi:hypothetical protein